MLELNGEVLYVQNLFEDCIIMSTLMTLYDGETISALKNKIRLVTPQLVKRKPFFLARVAKNTILNKIKPINNLRSILFHTHYKCNLNCEHCYEKSFENNKKPLLTLIEKKKTIKQALSLGIISFDFVGGESVLDKDLKELIKTCKPKQTYITLATNGYGLSEGKIRKLYKWGVDKLNISLDSWYPEEHDKIRGKKGVHASAFNTIKLCKKVGIDFHITVFVYKNSTKTEGFKKLVDYAIQNKYRMAFKEAIPLGSWNKHSNELVTEDDKKVLEDLNRKYSYLKMCHKGNRRGGVQPLMKLLQLQLMEMCFLVTVYMFLLET